MGGGKLNFASVILSADSGDRQKQREVCEPTFHRRKKNRGHICFRWPQVFSAV